MSVINGNYPRLITIEVPSYVPFDLVGDYVTEEVATILNEIGTRNYNPKSVYVKALSHFAYLLGFDTTFRFRLDSFSKERIERARTQRETLFVPTEPGETIAIDLTQPEAEEAHPPKSVDGKKQGKVAKG